jgi:beta-glucanase (GH16 family)
MKSTAVIPAAVILAAFSSTSAQAAPPAGYTLSWSDEFNQGVNAYPNSANWGYFTGYNSATGEIQDYTSDWAHAHIIGDGNATDGQALQIEATDDNGGIGTAGSYTSARLQGFGKQTFQYGFIEARLRMPYGDGIWPAFWMLGNDIGSVNWPACGEMDIMENIGNYNWWGLNQASLHSPNFNSGNSKHAIYGLPSGQYFKDGYHLFQELWLPNSISYYVDGNLYETHNATEDSSWPFNNPFVFLMNIAVGGQNSWPGATDSSTVFPQNMLVDYVRVYQPTQAPIANGNYTLTPGCATGSRLDAAASGSTNGSKVQIWQANGAANQTWRFTNIGGAVYTINPSYNSTLCLDVAGAGSTNGTLVDLWAANGTNAQKWNVISNLNGTFKLNPVCAPGLMLDVASAGTTNGTQVDIWGDNGSNAQQWVLTNTSNGQPLLTGQHSLSPACASGSSLDAAAQGTSNGTKVQIWQSNASPAQKWNFVNLGGNNYKLQASYDTALCLDVTNAGTANGTKVDLWADNGTNAQKWAVTPNGSGGYQLAPACATGSRLDVYAAGNSNGAQIDIYQNNGTNAQQWTIN